MQSPSRTLVGIFLLTTLVVGVAAPAVAQPIGDELAGPYLVQLADGITPAAVLAELPNGPKVKHTLRATAGFVAELPPQALQALRRDPRVVRVEADQPVAVADTVTAASWGLDRLDQPALPLDQHFDVPGDGRGVTVYVLDTGIRLDHEEFTGRVVDGYDALGTGTAEDCNGHGTHVAGTIAGATYGVAPAATLVAVRAFDCYGGGSWASVLAGLDWVTASHTPGTPAVLNMSLAGMGSDIVDDAVRSAIARGLHVVVAAGNTAEDACFTSPARVGAALTVGASTATDGRASFSNYGPCVNVFAPGAEVLSAGNGSATATTRMSGTSMAAPHVAGIAALHLQARPTASPQEVHAAVTVSATAGVLDGVGAGSPNLLASAIPPATEPPSAPTAVSLGRVRGTPTLSWSAPASDGDTPVTGYEVRTLLDGTVVDTIRVTGQVGSVPVDLGRGRDQFTFAVGAENVAGTGLFTTADQLRAG